MHRGEVGAGAVDEGAREGQAALVAVVEAAGPCPRAASSTGLQTTPTVRSPVVVGAVEDEHRQVDADLAGGQADAVGGVHRRDHVGDQRAQLVVVRRDRLLRAVHHRGAPAGHRADGAALGERAVRRVVGVGGASGMAGEPSEAGGV